MMIDGQNNEYAILTGTGTVHTTYCPTASRSMVSRGYGDVSGKHITPAEVERLMAKGGRFCQMCAKNEAKAQARVAETPAEPVVEAPKAPAKRIRKAAKPEVPSAVAEIIQFVLGGVQTAKTDVSKTVLTKAAGQLKAGQLDDARKTLYPIRTRVALKAIHMIKAL
jgi:hypothetical protein